MIRKLFLLAGAGFILTLICLAATAVLVRQDLKGNGFNLSTLEMDGDFKISPAGEAKPQTIINKTLEWTGGDKLGVDLPAKVTYQTGPKASVTITGPQDLVSRLRLVEGRLFLTSGSSVHKVVNLRLVDGRIKAQTMGGDLTVMVTAPKITRFDITGSGDLSLEAYDQPELSLSISGAGTVTAKGKTNTLSVDISGAGNAELAELKATDADVHISGVGNAQINATGEVRANVSGTGNITLVTRPAKLDSHVSGIGHIEEANE